MLSITNTKLTIKTIASTTGITTHKLLPPNNVMIAMLLSRIFLSSDMHNDL
ncbi:MAG: hypothetical protein ACLSHR_10165 [Oscillospiraceae bacterium]